MEPVDRPVPEGQLAPVVERVQITPGYFETMSIPIVDGRALEWTDGGDGVRSAVVNETLARAFWPEERAVGRMLRNQSSEHSWEVVGVVGDVRHDKVQDDPCPSSTSP
jgi:putative ABC transport system permease protein